MLNWCAYCQHFLHESAPFDDYRSSHGICQTCFDQKRFRDKALIKSLAPIISFQATLLERSLQDKPPSVAELMREAKSLSIRPLDLLMGILQPMLHDMGQRWSCGTLTVAKEHEFTALVDSTIEAAFLSDETLVKYRNSPHPTVLLATLDGSYHSLATQLLELYLASHQIATYSVYPGLPPDEILALVKQMSPRVLGISVGRIEEMGPLENLGTTLQTLEQSKRPKLIAGGNALRGHEKDQPALLLFTISNDLRRLLEWTTDAGS